jgi:hypothetical protein
MNLDDIQNLHEAGLISAEQCDKIIAHFGSRGGRGETALAA